MKYHQLQAGKYKKANRAGRGISAGQGRTAGRGTKGQGARKSGGVRPGFEGGQMPLYMRLPHLRGFKSRRPKTETVYTGQLEMVRKSTIDNQALFEAGLLSTPYGRAKLVIKGDVKTKKEVRLQSASKPAQAALKKAGGSFTAIERTARPAKSKK
ncbi:MAG TPA: 50S ribosomal protein L15 [Candidatus Saccharimonadales bacterium]|nr:50S ribosomal protein L15 [Candidatus Saccharimonadales bacterium]